MEVESGLWVEDEVRVGSMVEEYFLTIFSTSNPTGFDEVLVGMTPTVTAEMNLELDKNFTSEEVFKALKQMAPLTAPGPDGMSPIFYKTFLAHCW